MAGSNEDATTDTDEAQRAPESSSSGARPSAYLRHRCPLCFGGPRPVLQHTEYDDSSAVNSCALTLTDSAHVIVCLDANFQQKRRRSTWIDPEVSYIDGRFVDPSDVAAEEREVEEKRQKPARKRTKGTSAKLDDEVLDECEESFLAAQEKVTKASKNYYADTGLMAILCRHDRVLYVANMTTPGERQHYALVLLRKVLEGLPQDWRVGVLYDIACQLSRSIEKVRICVKLASVCAYSFQHDLLPDFADRLIFAVSVFHAYGHQWACQIVFHPRKRKGFGLTDGEGCERFWSALRALIPCLRVSGVRALPRLLGSRADKGQVSSPVIRPGPSNRIQRRPKPVQDGPLVRPQMARCNTAPAEGRAPAGILCCIRARARGRVAGAGCCAARACTT